MLSRKIEKKLETLLDLIYLLYRTNLEKVKLSLFFSIFYAYKIFSPSVHLS